MRDSFSCGEGSFSADSLCSKGSFSSDGVSGGFFWIGDGIEGDVFSSGSVSLSVISYTIVTFFISDKKSTINPFLLNEICFVFRLL